MTELFCSICQTPLIDKVYIVADIVVFPTEDGFQKAQICAVYMRCEIHQTIGNVSYVDEDPHLPDKPFFPNKDKLMAWNEERKQRKSIEEMKGAIE